MVVTTGKLCRMCGLKANASGYCDKHDKASKNWFDKYPIIFKRKKGVRTLWFLEGNRKWLRMSKIYLEKHFLCVRCGDAATETDHIFPVNRFPEKAFVQSNLQALCRRCHQKKTVSLEPRGLYPDYERKILNLDKKVKKQLT